MIKVIGIDPGLAATGFGIVTGAGFRVHRYTYGVITTPARSPLPERLERIFAAFYEILQQEQPDFMVLEDIFSLHKYPQSGITLGKVSGVLLLAGCRAGAPVREVAVREAKKILTGNGNASKVQLENTVRRLLCLETPIKPFHASDALALALIGLYRYETLFFRSRGVKGKTEPCAGIH